MGWEMSNKLYAVIFILASFISGCGGGDSAPIDYNPVLTDMEKNNGMYELSFSATTGGCSGYYITDYDTTRPARNNLIKFDIKAWDTESSGYYYSLLPTNGMTNRVAAGLILNDTFTTGLPPSFQIFGDRFNILSSLRLNDNGEQYALAWIDDIVFTSQGFTGNFNVLKRSNHDTGDGRDIVSCNENGTVTATKI